MSVLIPIFRPLLPTVGDVLPLLRAVDSSRVYTNGGPLVWQLEQAYGDFFGVPGSQVVAVANGTSGLIAGLLAYDETDWLLPAWTFAATPQSALRAGKRIIACDVHPETAYLDSQFAESHPGAGLLPVVPFGARVDLSLWPTNRSVVIDAAASTGASGGALKNLPEAWSVVFSLHATKILGCGEGGLIVCGSPLLADKIRLAANFGLHRRASTSIQGLNAKMPEVLAAYALASLKNSEATIDSWRKRANRAKEISSDVGIDLLAPSGQSIGPYWILKRSSSSESLLELSARLLTKGIECRAWWPEAIGSMKNVHVSSERSPCAEAFAAAALGLPMSVDQTDEEFERIESALWETRECFSLIDSDHSRG